ncbi:MAG: hypothetical protein WCA21_01700 [Terracidiphilus sp.]
MRLIVALASLATLIGFAVPNGYAASSSQFRSSHGTIVIVFKDGHRQSYNLADIERIEFPGAVASEPGAVNPSAPSRGHFLGKWEVGDGAGSNFYITLEDNGDAWRSLRHVHGHWEYVDGEARISWDDGPQDAIRKVGHNYQKFAYGQGKSFTDTADNVTNARNTTPHPI